MTVSEDWRLETPMGYSDEVFTDVAENLALDEALLIQGDLGKGFPVLRVWEPRSLAVVLGASRKLRDDVLVDRCMEDGIPIARRSSGGGTVVIGPGTLNATVVLPDDAGPGLGAVDVAQRFVMERFARSLRVVEPGVEVLGLGDLTVAGRKFVGSAQRRLKRWFLVHLTLLYDFPLELISRYLAQPGRQPSYRQGRSHEDFLMNLGTTRKIALDALRQAWLPSSQGMPPVTIPRDLIDSLVQERFSNQAWIERF